MILALTLLSCMPGPSPETLIDELRVVAITADPPQAEPGEVVGLDVVVADPADSGFDTLIWTCTSLGDGCLEGQVGEGWGTVLRDGETKLQSEAMVPAGLDAVLAEVGGSLPILTWTLACEPGLCPAIDAVADGETSRWLDDPTTWLGELPLEGVSLATRKLSIVETADHSNPSLAALHELEGATPSEEVQLTFLLDGSEGVETEVFGYTTAGGFSTPEGVMVDETGQVELTWFAPEEAGEAQLYVVALDELGGTAVWEATVTIE